MFPFVGEVSSAKADVIDLCDCHESNLRQILDHQMGDCVLHRAGVVSAFPQQLQAFLCGDWP